MALVLLSTSSGYLAVNIHRRPGACNGVNKVRLHVCDATWTDDLDTFCRRALQQADSPFWAT